MPEPARLARVAFKTSRLLDFVGRRELTAQIGHEPALWPLVVLKELLDNALDAAEEAEVAPKIIIAVSTESGNARISVTDNGPGIAGKTIVDTLDYATRTSSREAYVSPTRGAQGNALKTIIAMGYALSGECGETRIESRGILHRVIFRTDRVRQEPRIEHHQEAATEVGKNGTSVTVCWPDSACSCLEAAMDGFLQIAAGYVVLNPHLSFQAYWNDESYIDLPSTNDGWQKWRACDPISAHWYDAARLARHAAALVAYDQDRGQGRTVRDFIAEFRGLSGSAKQKRVLEETRLTRQPLAALFNDDDGSAQENGIVRRLLRAMQQHTRPVKPRDLGTIGSAHLLEFCMADGAAAAFRYRMIAGETLDGIPFVVEAAFAAAPDSDQARRLVLGINFAAALGNPFRTVGVGSYDGLETWLADQRCGRDEPVVLILHLAQARIEYQDRGKSVVVLDKTVAAAIGAALETVTGAWAKQRKAEERDRNRRLRRRAALLDEPRRVSIKEAAWLVMHEAYLKASDGGALPAKPRQIMYAARPSILELTGKDRLADAYFTQTLLPDYIEEHLDECADWDIVWDARGSFGEPHTGTEVPLGTLEVRDYLGLRTGSAPPPVTISTDGRHYTNGPECRYDTILFIEKEGFGPLFNAVQLAQRYDLATMSTKGMSVTAARMLLDRLATRGLKRILVLHDFDISGFSIVGTLGRSSRRYRFVNGVPLVDLGLRLNQVQTLGLESEPVAVDNDWRKVAATLQSHGASESEINFLQTRRVEINAMTSRQLVDFIEGQLEEHGVAKVIPDNAVLISHTRHLIEQRLARKAFEKLRPACVEQARNAVLPKDLREQVRAELEAHPEAAWDDGLAAIVARWREDA